MGTPDANAAPIGRPGQVEHPGLLPGLLTPRDGRSSGMPRRTVRDWCVDAACCALSLAAGSLGLVVVPGAEGGVGGGAVAWNAAVGVAACGALWLRRRVPVVLAVVLIAASVWFPVVAAASAVALFTVAVHRRSPTVWGVTALAVASAFVPAGWVRSAGPEAGGAAYWGTAAFGAVISLLLVGWGLALRARRQLVVSLRDRAERAEAEQRLRAEQARSREREAIAREMHDTLAHRLARLSMAAGALAFRPDAAASEITRGCEAIRENAHRSLVELRAIIGVLRDTDARTPLPAPQAGIDEVRALIEENRDGGPPIEDDVELAGDLPATTAGCLLRVVQEALTNARKHAPAAPVRLRIGGDDRQGIRVEVRNPVPATARTPVDGPGAVPGSGTGLIGLAERVQLLGGRFEYGHTAAGTYRVRAWLPWAE